MKNFKLFAKRTGLFLFAAGLASTANAQILRTSYTQDVPYALQMNPAMMPSHGYLSPLIGPLSVSASSNAFGTGAVQDMMDANGDYYKSDKFLDNLKDENNLNLSMQWDQISVGWYKGKNFWSFSTGTRIEMGATMPKSIFQFMNQMNGSTLDNTVWKKGLKAKLEGEKIDMMVYQEIGVGFARKITDKLTVGAKVKALVGAANMEFEISKMNVETPSGIDVDKIKDIAEFAKANPSLDWSKYKDYVTPATLTKLTELDAIRQQIKGVAGVNVAATGKASMGGLKWKHKTNEDGSQGYINGAEMNGFKIAGYGLAIDLGATYEVIENLKVTAAITDLGFINWSKSESKIIDVSLSQNYNLSVDNKKQAGAGFDGGLNEFAQKVASNEIVNYDMLEMKESDGDGYSSSLYTTLSIGGQYMMLDDKLVVGALYTGHFSKPKALNELTLSGAYNLSAWANIALSYSMIQSAGKSFGIGLKLGPVYLGTDYMFFGNDTKCANALIGLSLPLGKQKNS